MQQVIDTRKYSPMYIDKLTLYFTPSGSIIVRVGNQYIIATAGEVSELVQGRLAQHALIAELFNRESGETHE